MSIALQSATGTVTLFSLPCISRKATSFQASCAFFFFGVVPLLPYLYAKLQGGEVPTFASCQGALPVRQQVPGA